MMDVQTMRRIVDPVEAGSIPPAWLLNMRDRHQKWLAHKKAMLR